MASRLDRVLPDLSPAAHHRHSSTRGRRATSPEKGIRLHDYPVNGLSLGGWVVAIVVAVVIVCTLQLWKNYRECRNFYRFDRAFCASVVIR